MKTKKKIKLKKYPNGGQNPPTSQDSLDVYNQALKVLDYYRSRGYREDSPQYGPIVNFEEENKDSRNMFISLNNVESIIHPGGFLSKNMVTDRLPLDSYYRRIDNNRYYQREHSNSILDTRAPMMLYDSRIQPSAFYSFDNVDSNDILYGDAVGIIGYDPIAVKPEALLTPQERALKEQRYGKPNTFKNSLQYPARPKQQPIS